MSTTTTERPDVEAYLAAVRRELADLRPTERDELLADVEASLLDAAEESDAPIATRLGPPADFAAELRAAAGLAHREEAAPASSRLRALWQSTRAADLRRVLVELAPIWWVARAYVVVAVLAWLLGDIYSLRPPEVVALGTPNFGLLALAVAVSVALGLWQRRRAGNATLYIALNLALALAAVPVYGKAVEWLSNREYEAAGAYFLEAPPTPGLARDGVPLENVYAYSRDGRLLLDVLLYDQNGAPLNVRVDDTDPRRRVLQAKDGTRLFNAFPVRYYEPGSRRVARPGAAPTIDWSPIVTPPLKRERR